MKLVIKQFRGLTLVPEIIIGNEIIPASYIKDDFKVSYDDVTYEVSAVLLNGSMPKPTYNDFVPSYDEGEIIGTIITEFSEKFIKFTRYYPFATITDPIPVDPPEPGITITNIATTDITGAGLIDGSVTVTATGGFMPYEYSIDGINYQDSNIFTDLAAGIYAMLVRSKANIQVNTSASFTIQPFIIPLPPVEPQIKDIIALAGADLTIQNAYKRVVVNSVFGKVPSIITNGDFETYDGQNWEFWVKYGGINISRIKRTVMNSNGVLVPTDNYAIRFNQRANAGKWLEHGDIPVQLGDTIKISYNVGQTPNTVTTTGFYGIGNYSIPATFRYYYLFKMRIKVGNYYLYNEGNNNKYEWVQQLAYVGNQITNDKGDLNSFTFNFTVPECPVTGAMVIQLFGFQKIEYVVTEPYQVGFGVTLPSQSFVNELTSYDPIEFDNIKAVKSSSNEENDIIQITNVADNLRNFSQKPDPIDILFGDYFYREKNTNPLDNLYALTYNGQYTTNWAEFTGSDSKSQPFGMVLARSILQAFQKPFRLWNNGGLKLKQNARSFSYLDILSFDVKNETEFSNKLFAVLGCEIDLKTNIVSNVLLSEIFDKVAKSNDITIPSTSETPLPPILQDPNYIEENGIFTEEFTGEFR